MKLLVVSPHLDDGVIGCGDALAGTESAAVVTVFAGIPLTGMPAGYWDKRSGFSSGEEATLKRREEDSAALAVLGAEPIWLDFVDSQYGPRPSAAAITAAVGTALTAVGPDAVMVPMGLGHADHRLVRRATLRLRPLLPTVTWILYAEPIYRLSALRVEHVLSTMSRAGIGLSSESTPSDLVSSSQKRDAVSCYRSQLRTLLSVERSRITDILAPERQWLVTGATSRPVPQ
jgi:LmbE family N-acetylglucosaminyl deacetylase